MAVYYPFPEQIPLGQVSGAILLIMLISVFVIITVRRLPYLFVGWMWYITAILPVIGILQDMDQAMADRYHYLPSIGIAIMLAWGIPLLFPNENTRKYFLSAAAISFLIIMSVSTWKQCGYWKNSTTLSKHTIQATKNNFVAHKCLADAFLTEVKTRRLFIITARQFVCILISLMLTTTGGTPTLIKETKSPAVRTQKKPVN